MNELCFDANTFIKITDGADLDLVASVLQQFTTKFLYVENGKLYGVDDVTEVTPDHRLICYDGGFRLLHNDTNTTVCC